MEDQNKRRTTVYLEKNLTLAMDMFISLNKEIIKSRTNLITIAVREYLNKNNFDEVKEKLTY